MSMWPTATRTPAKSWQYQTLTVTVKRRNLWQRVCAAWMLLFCYWRNEY